MVYQLILSFEGLDYYGDIPDAPYESGPNVEVFQFEMEDWPLFRDDFIEPVNVLCDVLLDYSDVDYFDVPKCKLLHGWLQERLTKPIQPRLELLYRKLDEFAVRAIGLSTGVVVEF